MLDCSFCSVAGGASLLYLAAVICAPNFSKMFLLSATFSISFLPYPRSCLVFCSCDVGSAVPPRVAPSIFRLRGESGACSQLLSFLPLSAAVLYCTVLYCTVLYASFDVMAVGTNSLTCSTGSAPRMPLAMPLRSQHAWTPYRLLSHFHGLGPPRPGGSRGRKSVGGQIPSAGP